MNQLYFKSLFCCSIATIIYINTGYAQAQQSAAKHGDRYDLVANINKVQMDHRKIQKIKAQVNTSKEAKNKKDLKVQREKLKREKKALKKDHQFAKEQESSYKKNKAERIKKFEEEFKASDQRYEDIRDQIKKDLDKRNDFALQKHAAELLKLVQDRNEASTQLSMERADMIATVNAKEEAWKKVRQGKNEAPEIIKKVPPGTDLTTK